MRSKYLKILGLSDSASDHEIKKAFRRKALLYHPDVNNDKRAQEQFLKIKDAYRALLDDDFVEEELTQTNFHPRDKHRRENMAKYHYIAKEFKKKQAHSNLRRIELKLERFRRRVYNFPMSIFAVLLFCYAIIFLTDHFTQTSNGRVMVSNVYIGTDEVIFTDLTNADIAMPVHDNLFFELTTFPSVLEVGFSRFFKSPVNIHKINSNPCLLYVPKNIVYEWVAPILFLVPILWVFFRRKVYGMLVLANCLLYVYPIIFGLHIYIALSFRSALLTTIF